MKQLAFIYASIIIIILSVNLAVDPAHLLRPTARHNEEERIAKILLAKQQAVVPNVKIGFDERISRQTLLTQKSEVDHSVIFGSSRVRYFSKIALENEHHFVDAMNAATLEDLLVFSYLREKHRLLPKKLYIALDPWMIEKGNNYTRLVQVSYPEAFVQAVEHFQFILPEGSGRIYKNLAGNSGNLLQLPMTDVVNGGAQGDGNYRAVFTGKLPLGGTLRISFDGWIAEGTYYWAWRVLVNGNPIDEGSYIDNLQGSPSPHQPRTVITRQIEAKVGDAITLEMAHANGDGISIQAGMQQYNARNFSVRITCDSPAAQQFKSLTNCNGYLQPSIYLKYLPIAKEMVSPAYFQQSLKSLLQAQRGRAIPEIAAKQQRKPDANQANYIICSDGSLPWPIVENYDYEKVDNIVRTIDDGLVPLRSIDGNALKLLKQITDFYIRNGTEVAYVLVPVHPFSYAKWKSESDSRGFLLAEATYRKFASTNGIPIVGSYDPSAVGCKNTDFRDWVHPLPQCTNLVARALNRLPSSSMSNN